MIKPARLILFTALCIILALFTLETILRITDPLGAFKYFAIDLETFYRASVADTTRGYVLYAAEHHFSDWDATVLRDGTRYTPATQPADCTIAFVGDSITFGMGVNDGETWVNLLAGEYTRVHVINAGVIGYNISQVLANIRTVQADGYFYLMFDNDAETALDPLRSTIPPSALLIALQMRFGAIYPQTDDWTQFDRAWAEIRTLENVFTVGFDNAAVALRAGVPTVARWQGRRSAVDGHATARGNVEIAGALRELVGAFVGRVCN